MVRTTEVGRLWVKADPVFGNGAGESPTSYGVNYRTLRDGSQQEGAPLVMQNPRGGRPIPPPATLEIGVCAVGTSDTEVPITRERSDGTYTYSQTIASGARSTGVVVWETTITRDADDVVMVDGAEWLGAGEPPHVGESLQMGSLLRENYPTPADEWYHNPNQMGASRTPFDTPDQQIAMSGALIYHNADTVNGIHEGACHPPHFLLPGETNPVAEPNGYHDPCDETHPAMFYGVRFYQRVALCPDNLPAQFSVFDAWYYWPIEINNANRPFVFSEVIAVCLVSRFFDEVYSINAVTGVTNEYTPLEVPGQPFVSLFRNFAMSGTVDDGNPGILHASRMPEGYGGAVMRRDSDDFCVAVLVKLRDTDEDDGIQTALDCTEPCIIFAATAHGFEVTGPRVEGSHQHIGVISKTTTKRSAGWIHHRCFIYTGFFADLPAAAQELYESGAMDAAPFADLPGVVTKGTGFTGISGGDRELDRVS